MSTPSIALIALASEALPDPDAVANECGRLAEDFPTVTSRTEAGFTLSWVDGATANVTLVDRAIPWERLEGPCATAWYWPEAEAALRPHTHHLFITLVDEGRSGIDVSFRLTHLAVATSTPPAVGIVWGSSGAVHKPADFAQLAAQSSKNDLPLNLWIDFRAYQLDGGNGFGLFTTGMEALGRREFEVPNYAGDPQHLIGAAYNIAHYTLEKAATLKDSEVIGLPDESQVTVREDRSALDPEQEVFRLEFE